MSLLVTIEADMFAAKKAGDKLKGNLLNTFYSEAANVGKMDGNRESTDAEVQAIAKKFIKNSKDSEEAISKMSSNSPEADLRQAKISEMQKEREILAAYLPKQLSNDELKEIIEQYIRVSVTQFDKKPNMGDVMGFLKKGYAGLYDGKEASEIIKGLV